MKLQRFKDDASSVVRIVCNKCHLYFHFGHFKTFSRILVVVNGVLDVNIDYYRNTSSHIHKYLKYVFIWSQIYT